MSVYKYKAKNGSESVEGVIEAQNKEEAIDKINILGFIPVRVEDAVVFFKSSSIRPGAFLRRVKSRDVTVFTRQLASLIKAGVPILKALNTITNQSRNSQFKSMLANIQLGVRDGKALSVMLADYPKAFSPFYIAMVRSGESSGTLQDILFRVADYRHKQDQIITQIKTALAYPVLMAVVGFGTVFFMFAFVMPRLMRIFARVGQDLPLPTKIMVSISYGVQKWWVLGFLILAVAIFLIKKGAEKGAQRKFFSRLKLRLPLIGGFIHKSELARLSRTLEVLIRSGISILSAIEVAAPIVDNDVIRDDIEKSHKDLREGSSLGRSLESSKFIPEFMSSLIIVGEESGRLDEALAEVSSSYERETDEMVKLMTSLLEPIMILVMGLIVGFIVISMLLPIFQMNMMVQ
jgi:general secretion pathway protein F